MIVIHSHTDKALDHVFFISEFLFLCYQQTIFEHSAFGVWPEHIKIKITENYPVLYTKKKYKKERIEDLEQNNS